MYLKQIELLGFKSFPTKTLVKFSSGVTSIVGPNGCGKTNVLDALRWVLGEQKPTLLRGGKMEEVIFNGTVDMKPLGMAEVTLTVVNDNGALPTEYHEPQISRRLFRSGDSEYLVNKVPCRLKDITDLFVDTGLGAHSYSVIQQHMIDSVISDKAEERRFLFEEAAGITKYKQRRKAALRKLEATENDFLRLRDVYAEVKTRVNSLYRQHKKAERYQKLTERIKAWEVYLGSSRFKALQQEKRELQAEYDALADQRTKFTANLDSASGLLEADRKELIDCEHQISAVGTDIYAISEQAHNLEREISVLNEKKTNARQTIERNLSEIEGFQTRTAELQKDLLTERDQLAELHIQHEAYSKQLNSAQAEQAEADRLLLAARATRETEHRKLVEMEGRLSSGNTEVNSLRAQTDELLETIHQAEEAIAEILPRQREVLTQAEDLHKQLDQKVGRRSELENRRRELVAEIETGLERGEEISQELADLKASLEACEARRHLLEDMMVHYEGYESGVVAAMDARARWPQLAGTVADKFVPSAGMESVLQAALGEMARYLICHDRQQAEDIIAYLKSQRKGRVGILVPRSGTITPAVKRPDMDFPGVVGWLDTLVTTEPSLRPLMEAVLARTLVVDSSAEIDVILERLPYGFGAVSTSGILYQKNLISGGSDDEYPLFRRAERIVEQERELDAVKAKMAIVSTDKNRNTAAIGALRAESEQTASNLDEVVQEIEELQHRLSETEYSGRSLTAEFDRLNREKQNLNVRLESARGRQYSLGLGTTELATLKENLVSDIQLATEQLQGLEQRSARASAEVSRLQVATIESRSRVEQTEHQVSHIEQLIGEIEQNRLAGTAQMEQAQSDIELADQRLMTLEHEIKEAFERREQRVHTQDELRLQQTALMERTDARETQVRSLRLEKDAVSEKLHAADIRLTAVGSAADAMMERLKGEYDFDITAAVVERPREEISDEQAPALVIDLKEKLKDFGAVNLLALEEYDVANEREKFLGAQLNDLTAAKNDLKSTITKINKTARDLFTDTFTKVQKNFSELFVELFSGGEARISLLNPEDPLESDIEIIARPGGKKLLPITMLSGGERALTAIALLFSLYLVKPSPFCILDEIDAPLDDANCQRFLKIIKTFSQQTQFICITHNKITMEASDNLYGITMERPGVSKLVAVKFARQDDGSDELVTAEVTDERPAERFDTETLPESIRERINPGVTIKPDGDA